MAALALKALITRPRLAKKPRLPKRWVHLVAKITILISDRCLW